VSLRPFLSFSHRSRKLLIISLGHLLYSRLRVSSFTILVTFGSPRYCSRLAPHKRIEFCREVANQVPYYRAIVADFPKMQPNSHDTLINGVNINSITFPNSGFVEITWLHHQVVQPTKAGFLVIEQKVRRLFQCVECNCKSIQWVITSHQTFPPQDLLLSDGIFSKIPRCVVNEGEVGEVKPLIRKEATMPWQGLIGWRSPRGTRRHVLIVCPVVGGL